MNSNTKEAKPEKNPENLAREMINSLGLDQKENSQILKKISEYPEYVNRIVSNPEILEILTRKINGRRNNIRNGNKNKPPEQQKHVPQDCKLTKGMIFELTGAEKSEGKKISTDIPQTLDEKTAEIHERRKEKVQERANRGTIISLPKATQGKPLKSPKIKATKEYKVRTSIFSGLRNPVGIEISTTGADITEKNQFATLRIGDLRVTGIPPNEISNGILRGLFYLDVVKIEHSNEKGFALYPKLSFVEHLNGTKPVLKATVDNRKIEPIAGSYHTTPSKNGDILHLEPIVTQ